MHQQQHKKLTAIDLFSGAGGTGLGFLLAGFNILGAIELDESSAKTYEKNLGVKPAIKDINEIDFSSFLSELSIEEGQIDVLVGCPPCQGFSRMRNSNGKGDPRNRLVMKYLEFVKIAKPKFAVFENVPGIRRSAHGRRYYKKLTKGLIALGYHLTESIEQAADYGVPQFRSRAVVIGSYKSEVVLSPLKTHSNPKSIEVTDGKLLPWLTVRDTIGNSKFPRLRAGQNGEEWSGFPNHIAPKISDSVKKFVRKVPKNGGSRTDVSKRYWLECHKRHSGHVDVYGRLAWDRPANTITTGCTNLSKGRYLHPRQNRAISYREAAALQGFPDNFIFCGKNISKQIGNAVPPPMAYAIAMALKNSFDSEDGN